MPGVSAAAMSFNVLFPRLLLDIDEVDEQHMALADCLDRLAASVQRLGSAGSTPPSSDDESIGFGDCIGADDAQGDTDDFGEALGLLRELERLTEEHFRDEEAIMEKALYPDLADHRREHVLLLAELKEFVREIRDGHETFQLCHLVALKNWFVGHIVTTDMDFSRFLHGGQPPFHPREIDD